MTNPTIAEIAAKLPAAQRALLVEGSPSVRAYKPAQKLIERGLWEDDGDEYSIKGRCTPLGLSVRAYLQEQER